MLLQIVVLWDVMVSCCISWKNIAPTPQAEEVGAGARDRLAQGSGVVDPLFDVRGGLAASVPAPEAYQVLGKDGRVLVQGGDQEVLSRGVNRE